MPKIVPRVTLGIRVSRRRSHRCGDICNVLVAEQDGSQSIDKRGCFPKRPGDFSLAISIDVEQLSADLSNGERIRERFDSFESRRNL